VTRTRALHLRDGEVVPGTQKHEAMRHSGCSVIILADEGSGTLKFVVGEGGRISAIIVLKATEAARDTQRKPLI
jgi:hypothetical protein